MSYLVKNLRKITVIKFGTIFALLLILGSSFIPVLSVSANEVVFSRVTNAKLISDFTDEELETLEKMSDIMETTKLVSTTENSEIKTRFQSELRNRNIVFHVPESSLDLTSAKVLQVTQNSEDFYMITVPIVGDGYNLFSNLTVTYSCSGKNEGYQETIISQGLNNKTQIETYANGKLMKSNLLNEDFLSNEQIKKDMKNVQKQGALLPQSRGFANKVACLVVVLGISKYVATVIAGACVGSCPAIPVICAACVGGFVALGTGTMSSVVACFKL
ncbi:hypothetical protein [Enterococcus villorum]|uniref:Uncharacterized protein n=2 Tax=Enterococcus villorum TaxID=112904 RepID=A0A511J1N8_9ENTE|nr:hypothetical protein [Enterococcus villorum]EOH94687.1 hypothetical protein UAO_00077 [Enterococcus villorum ATCC 700913]EOW77062.1 hypothetical protein I591_02383 [Enterococcus villorum ATCC 700913]GEL91928.1 hypothetical protein EVI01_12650 [Enterococcus villorum]